MKNVIGVHRIAQRANVSIGTVDRALHERPGISQRTRERVLRIARELGYEPNLAARALSLRRTRKRIGVCMPRENHYFYDQIWEGIYDEARRHRDYGIHFAFRPLTGLGEDESAELGKMLRSGVQGVILSPSRAAEATPLINRAESAGVRTVCISEDAPQSNRSTIVGVDPRLSGLLSGELMANFVPSDSKVAVVTGSLRTEHHARKTEGFSASFLQNCPHGNIVRVIEGHENSEQSFEKVMDLLGSTADLAGIYVTTPNCLPVCKALEARALNGRVKVITTDLFQEMIPRFEDHTISASIYEKPYQQGQQAVRALVEHLVHDVPLNPTIYLNPNIVMRSNLELFRQWIQAKFSAKTPEPLPLDLAHARRVG
jgi:LacI family transcriptional regulator